MKFFQSNLYKERILILLLAAMLVLSSCSSGTAGSQGSNTEDKPDKTIVFADAGWDSIKFHNDVAGIILDKGYGYKTDVESGSSAITFTAFRQGDIDVYMEVWTENLMDQYNEAIDKGEIIETSINFDDNAQGLYVPTYVIKGDPAKGIKPAAPDLKTVKDLAKYPEVFKDEEIPSKGRIYGSPPGWEVDKILRQKLQTYGLDGKYNYFSPGSDTGLSASIAAAAERGQPWVGYYWEPTWVIGKYDMTLLEDEDYSDGKWNNGYACEWPSQKVTVAVHKDLPSAAPDAVEFLKKYKTSSKLTSEALAYMMDSEVDTKEAAKWFLKNHEDIWAEWVPDNVAQKVKEAIK